MTERYALEAAAVGPRAPPVRSRPAGACLYSELLRPLRPDDGRVRQCSVQARITPWESGGDPIGLLRRRPRPLSKAKNAASFY